jgi:hypothetical protein
MVGQGVLRECLLDPEVESVVVIGRNATGQQHEKLHEIVLGDLADISGIEGKVSGYDAGFCLGVSAVGMNEEAYGRVYLPAQIVISHLRRSPYSSILIEGQQTLLRSPW